MYVEFLTKEAHKAFMPGTLCPQIVSREVQIVR